ncbi:Rna-binding kh domain-containing protein [Thalictrum thalictroides]|uniref:Rna-binding kh domain-containing protein n=1 Tax=Thalictrum thalictroides TaxID=46969 RepID=A0A7J6V3Q4_THATH|nr:Rna-binding kh domain-containing protein [Thalictrum thalictroides]
MTTQVKEQLQSIHVHVPHHRSRYMLSQWEHICVIVTIGKNIDISMDAKGQIIELTMQPDTTDVIDLQRCASFIQAVILGFSIPVARVLLNRDNVYVDSINFTDINAEQQIPKQLDTNLLCRNINKTKSDIEQSTNTSIHMDNTKIYILGSTMCIKNYKDHLGQLISLYTRN